MKHRLAVLAALSILFVPGCSDVESASHGPRVVEVAERAAGGPATPADTDVALADDWAGVLRPYDRLESEVKTAPAVTTIDGKAVMAECGAHGDAFEISERGAFKILGCKLSLNFK